VEVPWDISIMNLLYGLKFRMPVSNLLSFYLFENDEHGPTPYSADTDKNKVPDLVEAIMVKKNSGVALNDNEDQIWRLWHNWKW